MRRLCRSQNGFSMIEALVALAILAIISAPIFGAFMVARSAQAESTGRAIAQSLARTDIEWLQRIAFDNFDDSRLNDNHLAPYSYESSNYPGYTITRVITDDAVILDADGKTVLKTVEVTVHWVGAKQRDLYHRIATKLERR